MSNLWRYELGRRKCGVCEKEFFPYLYADYAWKKIYQGKTVFFCSYTCMRAWQKGTKKNILQTYEKGVNIEIRKKLIEVKITQKEFGEYIRDKGFSNFRRKLYTKEYTSEENDRLYNLLQDYITQKEVCAS